ncbi:hypothetical protein, partial [Paracraurococcus lichenis]
KEVEPAAVAGEQPGPSQGCGGPARAAGLTAFARCPYCGAACGVMRVSEARAGGWLAAVLRACACGAPASALEPLSENEGRRTVSLGIVLPILVVPDRGPEG